MRNNSHFQSILKIISKLAYSRNTWEIFYDFMELSAICISNTIDRRHFDEREQQYLTTIQKYNPEHQKLFPEMFALLILALEHEWETAGFTDVLGCLFHELELHNKYKGQFFTPQHICTMMGKMVFTENDKAILEQGYISVLEPACGSGAMILGFAQAVIDSGYNHSQQILVSAVDIDIKCVYMCYIQLSLYGIPAVVKHGNSLTTEEWSHWYTPAYVVGGWRWKRQRKVENPENSMTHEPQDGEVDAGAAVPASTEADVIMPTKEAVESYIQLDLFNFNEGE